MKNFVVLSLVFSILCSSCHFVNGKKVRGNGSIKSENRTTSSFNNVAVSGNINIYVRQDSSTSVRVEADENLMEYIEVHSEGGRLTIGPKRGYNLKGSKDIKVYISAPSFNAFDASGACNIYTENEISSSGPIDISLSGASDVQMSLSAPKIMTRLSGAGSIQLKGETKDLSVDGSGSVNVKCMDMMAENVDVDISGAGNAAVFASVKLDVSVSGAGDVIYKGNASVNQHISGAGSVKKVD